MQDSRVTYEYIPQEGMDFIHSASLIPVRKVLYCSYDDRLLTGTYGSYPGTYWNQQKDCFCDTETIGKTPLSTQILSNKLPIKISHIS
jgi:hypothetical protein